MIDLATVYDGFLADLPAIFSLAVTALVGLVLVVWDSFRNDDPRLPWVAAITLAVCTIWELLHLAEPTGLAFYGTVRTGGFSAFVGFVVCLTGLLSIILTVPYLRRINHNFGEVYAIILFATTGMLFLGTSNHLLTVFVGLETMSICLYILTGLVREDRGATESALKYFLLGAFSTGFFLYGIALLYGATGTMELSLMQAGLAERSALLGANKEVLFWAGVALLFIGFLFKVGAVPFHMWTPDVYQGAPTPLTGYMATASKAAAFASLILILYYALPPERWPSVLAFIAVITMIVGNVLALAQDNVKRMLAYSSIAHVGYVLVALAAGTAAGYGGAMYYLLVYALMNVGAFGVIAMLEWDEVGGREQTLDSLAGVGRRRPLLGVMMGVFMFSLTGFPPLGGFMGKVAAFAPAVDAGLTWLVIIALLASAISAYYYLRVIVVFFMKSPEDADERARTAAFPVPTGSAAVLVTCAVLLLLLGILPGLMELTGSFFPPLVSLVQVP